MGLINGEALVVLLLRQLNADKETSELVGQLVTKFANAPDKSATLKLWLRAALAAGVR